MKDLIHLMTYITIYDKYARLYEENTTSLIEQYPLELKELISGEQKND